MKTIWDTGFSIILTYWVLVYLPVHFFLSQNKPRTFTILTFWSITMYAGGFLKLSYWDTRPYYAYADCLAWNCSCDGGKPSGHAIMAVTNSTLFICEIYYQMVNHTKAKRINCWFWVLSILSIIVSAQIILSRVILGAHSYNQVILGTQWALFMTLIYIFYYYQSVENLFKNIKTKSQQKKVVLKLFIIILVLTAWATLQTALMDAYYNPKAELFLYWSKCPKCKGSPMGGNFEIFWVSTYPLDFIIAFYMYCINTSNVQFQRNKYEVEDKPPQPICEKCVDNAQGDCEIHPNNQIQEAGNEIIKKVKKQHCQIPPTIELSCKQGWLRVGLHQIGYIPVFVIFAPYMLAISSEMKKKLESNYIQQSFYLDFYISQLLLMVTIPPIVFISNCLYIKCKVPIKSDFPQTQ